MKKHSLLFALFIFFSAPAFSQVLDDVTQSAFCNSINKIIAEYPTKFEAVKGEKINDLFLTKWNSKITISTDSKCEVYNLGDGIFGDTDNTWYFEFACKEDSKATNAYENLKNNLNFCTYACGGIDKKEEKYENSQTLKQYTITLTTPAPGYEKMIIRLSLISAGAGHYTVDMYIGNPVGF